jgi:transposase-like protein
MKKSSKKQVRHVSSGVVQEESSSMEISPTEVTSEDSASSVLSNLLHTEKQRRYFRDVIRLYWVEKYSKAKIARQLPVDRKTIGRWIMLYEQSPKEIEAMLPPMAVAEDAAKKIDDLQLCVQELNQKIKELEMKLHYEQLRSELFSKMIDITESKYNIQIRSDAVMV